MLDKDLHFQLLSTKEKMELCRAKLFAVNQFYAYTCIQFELKENNEIDDIAFDKDYLYYSSNINKYSRDDLTELITLKLLQYMFVFDLNDSDDKELLYLLIQYNYKHLINLNSKLDITPHLISLDAYLRYTNEYNKHIIINADIVDKIQWAWNKININLNNKYAFFEKVLHINKIDDSNVLYKEIPLIPYIEENYKDKIETLIQMVNYINANNDNRELQLIRLFWLLNLPQDLLSMSITYCVIHNKSLLDYLHSEEQYAKCLHSILGNII